MSVDILSKSYIEAALSDDSSIKTQLKTNFNPDQWAADMELRLSAAGVLSMDGGMDPRNWICTKETIGSMIRPGENLADLQKLAGTQKPQIYAGQKKVDLGISEDQLKLSSSNGGQIDVATLFTVEFQGLMKEISPAIGAKYGLKEYFPEKAQYGEQVQWNMIDPYTGKTPQYIPGTDPANVAPVGSRQIGYEAPFYREQMVFNEQELLFWRDLGSGVLGMRGALQRIGLNMEKLLTRLTNLEYSLIADGIYNNYFTFTLNGTTNQYLFGIPSGNRVTPVYGPWAWRANSSSAWNYNSSANPLWDLIQWVNNNPLFYKYRGMIPTIHMNPVTWGAFIQNPNVNSFVSFAMGNQSVVEGTGEKSYSKGHFVKCFVPGLEAIQIVVEDAAWIPDGNVTYDSNGYYLNSTAKYFLEDGYIFFGVNPGPEFGGPLGSFQQTIALQNGGINNPQPGKFIVMNDNINPGTLGGPAKPYIGLVSGMNGGLAIPRSRDVLSAMTFITQS